MRSTLKFIKLQMILFKNRFFTIGTENLIFLLLSYFFPYKTILQNSQKIFLRKSIIESYRNMARFSIR